ncbi:hypothetical protein V6511_10440 [Lactobacillus delbrueckii subsp. lactis]|uniref:hypothetical protein n=1 Tax=Lactobacillus delbrueckii TaxID=1584 RepID=UPI0030E49F9D
MMMKMPRTKSIKTIEAEISQTEEQLRRLKERCDKVSQKLDALYELKKHREQEELLKLLIKVPELKLRSSRFWKVMHKRNTAGRKSVKRMKEL